MIRGRPFHRQDFRAAMGLALMLEGAVWLAAPESMRRFMLLPDGAPLLRPDGGDAGAGGGLGGAAEGVRWQIRDRTTKWRVVTLSASVGKVVLGVVMSLRLVETRINI